MQTETSVLTLDINLIIPNKYQPRKVFNDNALNSLCESIKHYGIINPILVRKKDDKYEIIAGERRFRAAKKIGLTEVPVIVKNANEQQMAELALIENIQRQGLSPIEEAKSYEEIMRIGNQTQSSLAEKLGKSQSSIANKIRLLTLPSEIQEALAHQKISERHARSLINVENEEKQLELLNRIIEEKLTVKETEQIIKEKEITEDEIKQAINDIMKSLNISDEEEKEEKEDDNMNNGNFFPNFDNNNVANNNASLNMMNMQSMNQTPTVPESQLNVSQNFIEPPIMQPLPEPPANNFNQFGPVPSLAPETNINNNLNPMDNFMMPQNNMEPQNQPVMPPVDMPLINDQPLFTPQFNQPTAPVAPPMVDNIAPNVPVVDTPLFNPDVIMPTFEPANNLPVPEPISNDQPLVVSEEPTTSVAPPSFEVPVAISEPIKVPELDKLTELQNLLTFNGYNFKVYSNETENCVIIELPKN